MGQKTLYFFRRDPNGKGRGSGWYYHLGKGIFSKKCLSESYKWVEPEVKHVRGKR